MSQRIPVYVYSADLISQAGVAAQLRGRPEAYVVEPHAIDDAAVAVVIVGRIDDDLGNLVRAIQRDGCPKVVVVADDPTPLATYDVPGIAAIVHRGDATPEHLAATIVAAAEGRVTVSAGAASTRAGASARFNERERDVLALLADGHDTQEIAERLFYSERTIKGVIHEITTRLNLRNRSHAVAYAIKVGAV